MSDAYTLADLEAFLDEALTPEEMAELEAGLRCSARLVKQLKMVQARRDAGVHSLGAIWRRHRLSCPDRESLGSYLLNVLDPAHHEYVTFHVERIGCRLCRANLDDLKTRHAESDAKTQRHQRYFQSSVGFFRRRES